MLKLPQDSTLRGDVQKEEEKKRDCCYNNPPCYDCPEIEEFTNDEISY
jgi:hypothetical protein